MMIRLMPLPMPYSSICSPSHIRKTVPQVMISTQSILPMQDQRAPPRAVNCRRRNGPDETAGDASFGTRQMHHRQVAGVLVDLLAAGLAFLLQLLQRGPDAGQELEDDRGRDVGHDPQAEDRQLAEIAGAKQRHLLQEAAQPLIGPGRARLLRVHDRQRDLPADPIDRQQAQGEKDLPPQLRDGEDDLHLLRQQPKKNRPTRKLRLRNGSMIQSSQP